MVSLDEAKFFKANVCSKCNAGPNVCDRKIKCIRFCADSWREDNPGMSIQEMYEKGCFNEN